MYIWLVKVPLILTTIMYGVQSLAFFYLREWHKGVIFLGYTIANFGLMDTL